MVKAAIESVMTSHAEMRLQTQTCSHSSQGCLATLSVLLCTSVSARHSVVCHPGFYSLVSPSCSNTDCVCEKEVYHYDDDDDDDSLVINMTIVCGDGVGLMNV